MTPRFRRHGTAPVTAAVLHGGPGGAGEVAPVAQELARRGHGVLEPLQTQHSVSGQVEELRATLSNEAGRRVLLVGWSWGAWLGCLLTADHPDLVRHLVLVGCPPFREEDAAAIRPTRMARLTETDRREMTALEKDLHDPAAFERFMDLIDKADAHAPDSSVRPPISFDKDIHETVWREAAALRRSGALLETVSRIRAPVTLLHGDVDPHPFAGAANPLRRCVPGLEFVLLPRCGHKPWQERHARDRFFTELERLLG